MTSLTPNFAYLICGMARLVPVAIGKPGVAKTSVLMALASALNRKLYILTGSIREPADIGGYPTLHEIVMDDGGKMVCMKIVPPEYVVRALSEPHILFIDELTCCHPQTQSAMLAICAERRVGDQYLPDDLLIFAACNPPGTAANGYPLEATMANRLLHFKWEFPKEQWLAGMRDGLKYPVPQVPVLPEDWENHIIGVSTIMAEFHERVPGFLEPEEDEDGEIRLTPAQRSGPYPTPRTWDMAARGIAAAKSVNAPTEIQEEILRASVGYEASEAYFEYIDALDLPDPIAVLGTVSTLINNSTSDEALSSKLDELTGHITRPDKVRAFLGSVNAAVTVDNSLDNWNAAQEVFRHSVGRHKEVSLVCAGPLYRNKPEKAVISPDMVETIWNTIGRTMDEKGDNL